MYFLQQLQTQFLSHLRVYAAGEAAKGPDAPEFQDGLDNLDEAQKYLDALKASEGIVSKHITILGNFLEKVAAGKIEGLSPDDKEFKTMRENFEKKRNEYAKMAREGQQIDHIMRKELVVDIDTQLDATAAKATTSEKVVPEGKEFTQKDIDALKIQRNERKEKLEKIFQTVLGDTYTGGDIIDYKTQLESGILKGEFSRFQDAVKTIDDGDLQNSGETYTHDIVELTTIMKDAQIKLRDAQSIDGEKFKDIREQHLKGLYEKLQKNGSKEIKEIISSDLEFNGKPVGKNLSDLTAAELGSLKKAGVDFRELFLVTESGKAVSREDLQKGGSFVLNIGNNKDITEYNLSQFTEGAKTIVAEGETARYEENGKYGPGYYTADGKVHIEDGMKITITDMADENGWEQQSKNNQAERETLMKTSLGREMYKKAIANPDGPIEMKGYFGKIIAAILNFMLGKKVEQGPDGSYGTYNDKGTFTPVTGAEYMKKYTGNIRSHPIEYTESGVTACGRTAWKNLKALGAKNPERNDAHVLNAKYQNTLSPNLSFPAGMDNVDGPLQLFMDASRKNRAKGYRHTASAFKDAEGNWQVLDPYYGMNGKGTATQNPIPAGVYMNYMKGTLGKQFYGAFAV